VKDTIKTPLLGGVRDPHPKGKGETLGKKPLKRRYQEKKKNPGRNPKSSWPKGLQDQGKVIRRGDMGGGEGGGLRGKTPKKILSRGKGEQGRGKGKTKKKRH